MSLFYNSRDQHAWDCCQDPQKTEYKWALSMRCQDRSNRGGLLPSGSDMLWWHGVSEALTDAAFYLTFGKDETAGRWLRGAVMDICRRDENEWIGPAFRRRGAGPALGHLETAHLSFGVAIAHDLARDQFTDAEQKEIESVLRGRAIPMCRRWLESEGGKTVANWRCVLGAGFTVAAAVLGDEDLLDEAQEMFATNAACFQEDGSYAEGLQYGHYALFALTLSAEALLRRRPALRSALPLESLGNSVPWIATSILHRRPAPGFGPDPRTWVANFNDCGALAMPSSDVLHFFARHLKTQRPDLAALASWLADTYAPPVPDPGPHDRSSFGFLPRFGFMALLNLADRAPARSPVESNLSLASAFHNGDSFLRDGWEGKTVVALRGGGEALNGPGHLHADLGCLILAYKGERFLSDPGHSCYRGLVRSLDVESQSHSTLTFLTSAGGEIKHLSQKTLEGVGWRAAAVPHRRLIGGAPGKPVDRGARCLILAESGPVRVTGSSFGVAYGAPLTEVKRFVILCGAHVVFVLDHAVAKEPLATAWHWVFDNHDGGLQVKLPAPDRVICRRGAAGLKLFHLGNGELAEEAHGFMHLAYHPLPGKTGEGLQGSGQIFRFREKQAATERWATHAVVMDTYGAVAHWHLKPRPQGPGHFEPAVVESPGATELWSLTGVEKENRFTLCEEKSGLRWALQEKPRGSWELVGP